jgi:hypothetical protein
MKKLLLNIIYYIFQYLFLYYIYIYSVDRYLYSVKGPSTRFAPGPGKHRAGPAWPWDKSDGSKRTSWRYIQTTVAETAPGFVSFTRL